MSSVLTTGSLCEHSGGANRTSGGGGGGLGGGTGQKRVRDGKTLTEPWWFWGIIVYVPHCLKSTTKTTKKFISTLC